MTNTGNVTVHGIDIDETAFSGTGTLSPITCTATTLAPGQQTTCTATYTVTQADVDAGDITNTAHAAGTAPGGGAVTSPPSTVSIPQVQSPALGITKTASPATVTAAGTTVTYSFTVTNTGNVTVHGITIVETAFSGTGTVSAITCPVTTLAPGEHTICTASYAITQADMNAGHVTNTAHAAGTAPNNATVTSPSATAMVTATQTPSLSIVKSAVGPPIFSAGQVITYTFEVTNTGNVTVDDIAINEVAFSGTGTLSPVTCAATTLAPGEQTTCTATYAITQADINAGHIADTADATGTAPDGSTVTSQPSTVDIPQVQAPELSLSKTVLPAAVGSAGDTVTYTFTVTNSGNVTISGIAVEETAFSGTGTLSAITCPVTTLEPGQSTPCTATYTITQADMDAGQVTNTAEATGIAPNSAVVTSPESTATVTAAQAPSLTLVKSASPSGRATFAAGEVISYSFEVTNTGNVTVDDIAIDETAFSGTGTVSAITCPVTTLAPGEQTTCTATYTVTQADVDAGEITNTAEATGMRPDGVPVTSPPSMVSVPQAQTPALTLSKSASPATVTAAGTTVTYSFHVTNTGNVTVHGIAIVETAFSGTGTVSAITCTATTLAPGASTTCTATYIVTQADIDAGTVTNTAHATGTAPNNATVNSPPATATVTASQSPVLAMSKTASPATVTAAGTTVTYSFHVTNTGNVTVHGIAIEETAFSGTGTVSAITCTATTLAPGASTTCTATYIVTQADIDAGTVTNTAHAAGLDPAGAPVTSPPSTATVTVSQATTLALTKTVSPATVTAAGTTVTYSFHVTNTGNVTIHGIAIEETAFSGTGTLSPATCTATTLAPAASTTCTATYIVTQADIDAGTVTNTAHASGTAPDGTAVISPPATATVTVPSAPALDIVKSVSPATVTAAGDAVTYSFTVTNSGNVTMHGIAIEETAFSGTGTLSAITCPVTTLAPGVSTTCTATYTITQADMNAGTVTNTAHATGLTPDDAAVTSPPATATVTATQAPALSVVKSAVEPPVFSAGQVVTYNFAVTNTGNVTVSGIAIDETAFSGTGTLSPITCTATTLAPGASTTCTATYTLTVADIDAGQVTNTAEATGTAPDGAPVTSPPSSTTVPLQPTPELSLTKAVTPATVTAAGDTVTYSFGVTNTGNVTVHGIAIEETAFSGTGALSPITCTATTLAPGASTTCTATYTITQADMDAGRVTNTAHATGLDPGGAPVTSPPATATVTASQAPALALSKTASPATVTAAGDTVTYSFGVTNAGNVTVHGIAIEETAFSGTGALSPITCTATTLAPGASTTCTASYTVTQADIDAGTVTNTALAAGTAPEGTAVISPPSTATVTAGHAPALAIAKSVSPATVTAAGDAVTYSFTVTNTGNVTVHGIAIEETAFSGTGTLSAITCPVTTLAPGVSTTCTATYTITQADIDAGAVTNTAHAAGIAPDGAAVTSPPATATVTATQAPALALTKTASPATVTMAGTTVTYSFGVTNTGNVTVHGIAIDETAFSGTGTVSAATCTATTLAPGASTTCTATYTITQADIDAGQVTNTAEAAGTAPGGAAVTSPPATATVTATGTPALTVVKSATPATVITAGTTVTYSFDVTNTGNVTVHGIAIDETAFSGTGTLSPITCPVTTLAPGESTACTATYAVTQADMDAGRVTNTAHATGTGPDGTAVTSSPSSATVTVSQSPVLALTKTASPGTVTAPGTTVTYTFDVTNVGNLTVHGIAIDETAFSGTGTLSPITCPVTTLAPGESTACTATYAVTQADIDAGQVTNSAQANGNAPDGTAVNSPSATAVVLVSQTPALGITKTVSPATVTAAGTTVTYTFTVTNTGNVTVHGIDIDETAFSGTGVLSPVTCLDTTLVPGASITCTATYEITQADVEAGHVTNTAEAIGFAPDGAAVTSPPATATVAVTPTAALSLVKSASGPASFAAGQVITYSFEVTNTGNVTVHGITIDETAFTGTGTLSPITCPVTTLAPGEQTTCTATYTLTQADIDAGHVTNTAEAAGTVPDGSTVTSPPSTVTVPQAQTPALTLSKTASPATVTTAGTTVTYSFHVANTGNVTVHGIAIDETAFTGTGTLSPITCPVTTLAPGEQTTCTATYVITQADMNAGTVTNTARAAGKGPNEAAVTSPPATATLTASQAPALTLSKTASPATVTTAGTTVTYSFHVANTGNVTISAITIEEIAFSGTGTLSPVTCPVSALAPGKHTICTATYVVTEADVNAGMVTNTATATAKLPSGKMVTSAPSSATLKTPGHKKAITSGVPGSGSGPSLVKIGLGAGLILFASGGMIGLATRRRRSGGR